MNFKNFWMFTRANTDGSKDITFNPTGQAGTGVNLTFDGQPGWVGFNTANIDNVIPAGGGGGNPQGFVSVGDCQALLLQADGKILGIGRSDGGANEITMVRLTANGDLDATFNPTRIYDGVAFRLPRGVVQITRDEVGPDLVADPTQGAYNDIETNRVAVQDLSGKIIIGGVGLQAGFGFFGWLGKFNLDGSIDTTWGGFTAHQPHPGGDDGLDATGPPLPGFVQYTRAAGAFSVGIKGPNIADILVDSSDNIIFGLRGGDPTTEGGLNFGLSKCNPDGSYVTTFGNGEMVGLWEIDGPEPSPGPGQVNQITQIAFDRTDASTANCGYVAAGYSQPPGVNLFSFGKSYEHWRGVRYSFQPFCGIYAMTAVGNFTPINGRCEAVVVQSDQKSVAVGWSAWGAPAAGETHESLVRYT